MPFHHPWKWHTEYAGQTARLLSRRYIVFCFLWAESVSIRDIVWDKMPFRLLTHPQKNLYLYQPLHIVPFRRFAPVRAMNFILNILILEYIKHRVTKAKARTPTIVWLFGFFEPLFVLLPLILGKHSFYFDCIDIAWQPVQWKSKLVEAAERRLIVRARWMSVHSLALLRRWKHARPSISLVPTGINLTRSQRRTGNAAVLPFKHKQPVIGYIGAIDYRINFPLLREIAKRNPQWNFFLVGPIFLDTRGTYVQKAVEELKRLPNVRFAVAQRERIADILASFDIGIIPYNTSLKFNRYSYPLKLMEYFLAGLPVVATDIYELRRYPELVARGQTPTTWKNNIRHFLASPLNKKQKAQAKTIARSNSWESKLSLITKILEADAP